MGLPRWRCRRCTPAAHGGSAGRGGSAGQGRAVPRRGMCAYVYIYTIYIYMSRVHITCNLHSDDALQFIYTWANAHNHKKAHTRYLYMGKYNHVRLSVRIHKHAPMHKRRTCMHINIYMCIYMHVCVYVHVCDTHINTYIMDACVRLPQTPSHDVAHTLDPQIENPHSFFAFW